MFIFFIFKAVGAFNEKLENRVSFNKTYLNMTLLDRVIHNFTSTLSNITLFFLVFILLNAENTTSHKYDGGKNQF